VLTDDIANEIVDFPPKPANKDKPRPMVSAWRAWKLARQILLNAIIGPQKRRTKSAFKRFRRQLSEAP
jgi:hypothetical protein